MLKKIFFTAFLAGLALSANAQIATPQLDAGFHTYGGAAAGWRYGSTINLVGLSAEGKATFDDEEVGDVTAGMNAKGPEDSSSPIPFLLAAYRGETFAGELYSNIADGLKTDIEMKLNVLGYPDTINIYNEEKELRVNLAYVIGEMVSIGLGYSSISDKTKIQKSGSSVLLQSVPTPVFGLYDSEEETETSTVGTSISASVRLAEIFFVAAGMESVVENGTFKQLATTTGGTVLTNVDGDFVENSWTNTIYGVAFLMGDPGDTQFRAEYSMISSPESEKDADGSKFKASHPQTTKAFASIEAKFSDFLIAYQSETEKEAELNNEEKESVKTLMGLGWQPMSGLTLSLYAFESKITKSDSKTEQIFNPKGYRFFIGYNF